MKGDLKGIERESKGHNPEKKTQRKKSSGAKQNAVIWLKINYKKNA
ncbi:MAG: hypothetical protein RBS92_06820 [Candidatus Cloacimonadales bacterium]|jgi:hypothetical protein|nr:hypothetical protein [Candidatus Cloacimonadales bacterium]